MLEFNPLYDVDLTRDHKLNKTENTKQTGTEEVDSTKNGSVTEETNTEENGNQNSTSDTNINNTTGSTSEETAGNIKTHYDKYSDTPQGSLQNVQNDTYLTNARMINDTDSQTGKTTVTGNDVSKGTTTSNTDTNNTVDTTRNIDTNDRENRNTTQSANRDLTSLDDYLEHVKGKNGGASYSALLNEYRQTFLNIDMQVINELDELFMLLW